jgi:hypothetical protein
MVLIKIEAQITKKRSKRRDRNFSDIWHLRFFDYLAFEKRGGGERPPPISKRIKI